MSEQDFDTEIVSDTSEEMMQELLDEAAAGDVEVSEIRETEQRLAKLFTLTYHIPFEDYVTFQMIMGRESIEKGRKRTILLGSIQLAFGIIYLAALWFMRIPMNGLSWFIVAVLIGSSIYGLCYYRFFYEKALRKMLKKQYERVTYLRSEITVDFYPNRFIEHVGDQKAETFWHTIQSVRTSENLYMIMLDEKRCLLIPKQEIQAQAGALNALLEEVCKNFEKPHQIVS